MQWKKDPNMKYTDMCIYIDQNVDKIIKPGENPDIENKIYNYLWLLVKALAIKKCMFTNFQDYDPYAFYAATRLFFALRKNQLNQGKTIKGKVIRPIKSCLNYTKALLYPMKIEYQRESYNEVISEEFVSKKFDAFSLKEQMKNQAIASHHIREQYIEQLKSSFENNNSLLDKVLEKSPFTSDSAEYKHLKISLILNSLNSLKQKKRLDTDMATIILWKLPKSMTSYVRILLSEFYTEVKLEIMDCYSSLKLDDNILEKLISNSEATSTYED